MAAKSEKRWTYDRKMLGRMESCPEVDAFLREVLEVSKRHNMSIVHEDSHGAFIVMPWSEKNAEWLFEAFYMPHP